MSIEKQGVLIVGPDGTVYDVPASELQKFVIPKERLAETVRAAEAAGFVGTSPDSADGETSLDVPQTSGWMINIFVGQGSGPPQVAKYGGGPVVAKYAGGPWVSKYAGGPTVSKYAGGPVSGSSPIASGGSSPVIVFYGKVSTDVQ